MEITIKIDFNEENMKKFADIFWAPIIAKIDEENEKAEKEAEISEYNTAIDLEPKVKEPEVVEPEDDFAQKYPQPLTPETVKRAEAFMSDQAIAKKHQPVYSGRPISDWSEFPEMLAKRLGDSPMTKRDIADKIGVRYLALHKWETGESAPYQRNLAKLCKLFDWDYDYMCGLYLAQWPKGAAAK